MRLKRSMGLLGCYIEDHSINHPPYFNGEDYPYWKDRMKLFIESTSLDIWEIIENGDYISTVEQPPPVVVRTIPRNEWTDQPKTKVQINAKVKVSPHMYLEQK